MLFHKEKFSGIDKIYYPTNLPSNGVVVSKLVLHLFQKSEIRKIILDALELCNFELYEDVKIGIFTYEQSSLMCAIKTHFSEQERLSIFLLSEI
ncbi:MAG: hypothetical protein INQ03_07270 [Candidatus Heimdallarchaeota archaeon]|nr:hypothetical protein [Candidatus Heimdallarchaeota archaeon]